MNEDHFNAADWIALMPTWWMRCFAADLADLGFATEPRRIGRLIAVGYTNGLLAGTILPTQTRSLLQALPAASGWAPQLLALVRRRLGSARPARADVRGELKRVGEGLAERPPLILRHAMGGFSAERVAAHWLELAVGLGLLASTSPGHWADSAARDMVAGLSDSQRFLSVRVSALVEVDPAPVRRHAFISFVRFCYPETPVERACLTAAALSVWRERARRQKPFLPAAWIRRGFEIGRAVEEGSRLVDKLRSGAGPKGMANVVKLRDQHVGADPADWTIRRVHRGAMAFAATKGSDVAKPWNTAFEFERLRVVFGFAFWMGLACRPAKP